MTRELPAILSLLPMILCVLVGCTSTYTVCLRDRQTLKPIANAPVTISSVPRIYSFLDPRHYLGESGKPVTAEGKTDSQGQVSFDMPTDLDIWHASLGESWILEGPSTQWMPMMTRKEFETDARADQLRDMPGRPEVKVQKK